MLHSHLKWCIENKKWLKHNRGEKRFQIINCIQLYVRNRMENVDMFRVKFLLYVFELNIETVDIESFHFE